MIKYHARIDWLTPGEGGRQTPPIASGFMAGVDLGMEGISQGYWSVKMDFAPRDGNIDITDATFWFIAPYPENQSISAGQRLHFLDGPRKVARVEILERIESDGPTGTNGAVANESTPLVADKP